MRRQAAATWLAWSVFLLFGGVARGDQVGIDKVRLVEEEPGQYVLEVDSLPRFAAVYRTPVLPKRFELTDFELTIFYKFGLYR